MRAPTPHMIRRAMTFSLTAAVCITCSAENLLSKNELKSSLEQRLTKMLTEAAAGLSAKAQAENRIPSVTERMVSLADRLPEGDIREDVACWFQESLTDFIERDPAPFLGKEDQTEELLRDLGKTRVLESLTLENGDKLLRRRTELTTAGRRFRKMFRAYLTEKLSKIDSFRLRGQGGARTPGGSPIEFAQLLRRGEPEAYWHPKLEGLHSFRSRTTESEAKILTIAFVRYVDQLLMNDAQGNHHGEGNLFSLLFDGTRPEGSLRPKTFNQVLPAINELYHDLVSMEDGIATIDLTRLRSFPNAANRLRYGEWGSLGSPFPEQITVEIEFSNAKDAWRLLDQSD